MVDENIILLRIQIREIEMVEMKGKASSDWSEWEKKYFQNYGSDLCEAVELLQRLLINTRPSFALATFALLMLTISMPIFQLLFHFLAFAKGILWFLKRVACASIWDQFETMKHKLENLCWEPRFCEKGNRL